MADSDTLSPQRKASNARDGDEDSSSLPTVGFKKHRAKVGKRLAGRPPLSASSSSLHSLVSQSSADNISKLDLNALKEEGSSPEAKSHSHHGRRSQPYEGLVSQISSWMQTEKDRRAARKAKRRARKERPQQASSRGGSKSGSPTEDSEDSESLEKLERILSSGLHIDQHHFRPGLANARNKGSRLIHRRSSNFHKLKRPSVAGSSDTDYIDGDAMVPTCDAVLDNSKTLAYSGGGPVADGTSDRSNKATSKEEEAWSSFKNEILRLAHTLKLKGWRNVPLDHGDGIDVERLSGALTNAVYVVSPPKHIPDDYAGKAESTASLGPKRPPAKLLLRIYGPQVEHLIDREVELQILKRLARKNIGPRLLGTFKNGRFEEFYYARTLGAQDLRIPETSAQIAKRMRELHDGIELLEGERDAGPSIWHNWDKWVERCEQVISSIDHRILSGSKKKAEVPDAWKDRGLICGVEWHVFRNAVDKYRAWLDDQYGGPAALRDQLVFAHNDTQYGNILRLEPSGHSPLLLPANAHKRLVVIDFEYASANLPGVEFANHFTEWCYNYHDAERPYVLNSARYPNLQEQTRFLRSYVEHHSPHPRSTLTTPVLSAADAGPSSSISSFMLESRYGSAQTTEEEPPPDPEVEREIERLLVETRLWRVANSAQWVAWAIVQAKVPELDEAPAKDANGGVPENELARSQSSPVKPDVAGVSASQTVDSEISAAAEDTHDKRPEGHVAEALRSAAKGDVDAAEDVAAEAADEEEFDYLSYARERAMLFWGDIVALGVVDKAELPAELLPHLKVVSQ